MPILPLILESILLTQHAPLSLHQFKIFLQKIPETENISITQIKDALLSLQKNHENHENHENKAYELIETASGWRIQIRQIFAPWVQASLEEKPPQYSRALFETLALIAYKQPLTRADIEGVRGVSVSPNILKTLLEREWIKVVGHRETPGRPALFGTTPTLLDELGLKSLNELPALPELTEKLALNI